MKTLSSVVNIGFKNFILTHRIIGVLDSSLPASKRIISYLKREDNPLQFMNCTQGKRARSLIILDQGMWVLTWKPMVQLVRQITNQLEVEEEERPKNFGKVPKEKTTRIGVEPQDLLAPDLAPD
jgi:regulator of extracellular matrix RemA (YlzA/DUF370 family)